VTNRRGQLRRAWLIVPAASPARLDRASSFGADVVVVDLAYFPGGSRSLSHTDAAASAIAALAGRSVDVFVQINGQHVDLQLPHCVQPGLAGVVLTGLESPEPVRRADELLSRLEKEHGLTDGGIELIASIDTAKGNYAAEAIAAAARRTTGLTLGRADLSMDLRPEPSGEIHLLPYLAQRLILLAGAFGQQPIGAWWTGTDRGLSATPERTLAAACMGRAMGFKGAMCVREDQVAPLLAGFAPPADDQGGIP
jgi:citrate lyase subunit beta / citryl-CoA lyase